MMPAIASLPPPSARSGAAASVPAGRGSPRDGFAALLPAAGGKDLPGSAAAPAHARPVLPRRDKPAGEEPRDLRADDAAASAVAVAVMPPFVPPVLPVVVAAVGPGATAPAAPTQTGPTQLGPSAPVDRSSVAVPLPVPFLPQVADAPAVQGDGGIAPSGLPVTPLEPVAQTGATPRGESAVIAPPLAPGARGLAPVFAAIVAAAAPAAPRAAAPAAPLSRAARPFAPAADAVASAPIAPALPLVGAAEPPPPLDLAQGEWPQRMIDRIERLRDDMDAQDGSIRIVPDALGRIDVSLRRDGDVTRVHFAAEQAATRALLADSQPRLAELAEARGLRLAGGGAETGGGGGDATRRPPKAPAAPVRAPAGDAPAASRDHRVA